MYPVQRFLDLLTAEDYGLLKAETFGLGTRVLPRPERGEPHQQAGKGQGLSTFGVAAELFGQNRQLGGNSTVLRILHVEPGHSRFSIEFGAQ